MGNSETAEDVVQDVLLKVWDNRSKYKIENPEAWCMRLTRNLCIDHIRSKKGYHLSIEEAYDQSDSATGPYKTLENSEEMAEIRRIMDQLPLKQKEVVMLRDLMEYSYQEIAKVLQIELNDVKVNIYRARQKIKNELIKRHQYGLAEFTKSF